MKESKEVENARFQELIHKCYLTDLEKNELNTIFMRDPEVAAFFAKQSKKEGENAEKGILLNSNMSELEKNSYGIITETERAYIISSLKSISDQLKYIVNRRYGMKQKDIQNFSSNDSDFVKKCVESRKLIEQALQLFTRY